MLRRLAAAARRLAGRSPPPSPNAHALARHTFDRRFYLKAYPDVAESGADPFDHFMSVGWRERRDPNSTFSVREYLEAFPELEASGVNPLVHALTVGPKSGRPESPQGFRFEVIEQLTPVSKRLADAVSRAAPPQPAEILAVALDRSRDGLKRLHLTFSHDDFTTNVGGVQACLGREAARLAELGRDHLHLHPAAPWPLVRMLGEAGTLGVVWNGQPIGAFAASAVVAALAATTAGPAPGRSFAIHSLLGHTVEDTVAIVTAAGLREGTFWLHDFASLCAGVHLLRNDVQDCGAPPPGSAACGVCIYGPWRARHVDAHQQIFERLRLTLAAPSQVTLDLWRAVSAAPVEAASVLPHAILMPRARAVPPPARRPLRVAFAGMPSALKGWNVFRALLARFGDDPRYEFVHLGGRQDPATPVSFHSVRGGAAQPAAMRDALEAGRVDVVLIWPLCRETFSFVAYEAVAAGCAVVTGPDSGNVAAFVHTRRCGRIFDTEAALTEAFEDGEIMGLSRTERRPMLYDLVYSTLSLDLEGRPS